MEKEKKRRIKFGERDIDKFIVEHTNKILTARRKENNKDRLFQFISLQAIMPTKTRLLQNDEKDFT